MRLALALLTAFLPPFPSGYQLAVRTPAPMVYSPLSSFGHSFAVLLTLLLFDNTSVQAAGWILHDSHSLASGFQPQTSPACFLATGRTHHSLRPVLMAVPMGLGLVQSQANEAA